MQLDRDNSANRTGEIYIVQVGYRQDSPLKIAREVVRHDRQDRVRRANWG